MTVTDSDDQSLTAQILEGIDTFRGKYPDLSSPPGEHREATLQGVLDALNEFMECVRYLNNRRSRGAILRLEDEAAVQDALYLMLRPWIPDLIPENPTDKVANRYSIKDFLSQSNRLVIEAKFIRDKDHGKSVVKELNDDIETYRYHPHCDHLVFFIFDPDSHIPDSGSLSRHLSEARMYSNRTLNCYAVIKP